MSGIRFLRGSDVVPEAVRWLWPSHIPLGKLVLAAGNPGLAKSTVTYDLIARLTRGASMPDGTRGDPDPRRNVLVFTSEDGVADTVSPRLNAAGADMTKVHIEVGVTGEDGLATEFNLRDHADKLEGAVQQYRPLFTMFDPLSAYVGKIDSHRDSEVRQLLRTLGNLAETYDFAAYGIAHLNKGKDLTALMRILGSVAFGAAARSVLGFCPDPQDDKQIIFGSIKQNLAERQPALAFKIEKATLTEVLVDWLHDEPIMERLPKPVPTIRIAWMGTRSDVDIEEEMQGVGSRDAAGRVAEAVAFLSEELRHGPVPSTQAVKDARQAGIAARTLDRAKKKLGVTSRRVAHGGRWEWVWELAATVDVELDRQPSRSGEHGDLGALGDLGGASSS